MLRTHDEHVEERQQNELSGLEKLTEKYKNNKPKYIEQVEELFNLSFSHVVFSSDNCEWSERESTFDNHLKNKSQLVFLIEDENDNVFGAYVNSVMRFDQNNSNSIEYIYDMDASLFTLQSNGRYSKPTRFDIPGKNSFYAVQLYDKYDNILISFGGKCGDIVIYKKGRIHRCFCNQTSYIYASSNSLTGSEGENSPFTLKRIQVFKMTPCERKDETKRILDESWKIDICKLLEKNYISTIFDSTKNNWECHNSVFDECIMDKRNVAILIEDIEENIFGIYHHSKIADIMGIYDFQDDSIMNYDKNSYIFSLQRNGKYDKQMKFKILPEFSLQAFKLYNKDDKLLFNVGNNDMVRCIP